MIYRVYGLFLYTSYHFPELPAVVGQGTIPDIHLGVTAAYAPRSLDAAYHLLDEIPLRQVYRGPGGYLVRITGTGDFRITPDGGSVICRPISGTPPEELRACFLGPVMALCLQLRQVPVLHASAVIVAGHAVAFAGRSGGGKSTLAAAFLQHGFPLLSDDLLALRQETGVVHAAPGYPALKLWPASLSRLVGELLEQFPLVYPGVEKRQLLVGEAFYPQAAPVNSIYLLSRTLPGNNAAVEIVPLFPRDAAVELLRYTYGVCWMEPAGQAQHLEAVCRVVEQVPVFRLCFPCDLDALPQVCQAVLDHYSLGNSQDLHVEQD